MVYETIEPSQLTDSPGSSSTPSSPASSVSSEYTPLSTPPPQPTNRRYNKRKSDTPALATHDHSEHEHDEELRVKRHQTKLACTWCRKLSKKCDAQRPCARCIQFDRCDECVDAPPRRPRQRGLDRGTYKKTRDLAAVDYDQARKQREAYVEKVKRKGRVVQLGLTADAILEKTKRDEARFEKQTRRQQPRRLSSESLPESLFSESQDGMMDTVAQTVPVFEATQEVPVEQASPELDDLSSPTFPASPLFDVLSPQMSSATEMTPPTEFAESDFSLMPDVSLDWQAWELYPNVMKLIASTQVVEPQSGIESEDWQRWTDTAIAA